MDRWAAIAVFDTAAIGLVIFYLMHVYGVHTMSHTPVVF